jgi:hypothetical protein
MALFKEWHGSGFSYAARRTSQNYSTLLFAACLFCPRLFTRYPQQESLQLIYYTYIRQLLDTTAASLDHPAPANWSPCALLLPFLV